MCAKILVGPDVPPKLFSDAALRLIDATYNNNKMQVATKGKMLTYLSKPEISLNPQHEKNQTVEPPSS